MRIRTPSRSSAILSFLALPLVFLASAATALEADPGQQPFGAANGEDAVTLKFHWPVGLVVEIESRSESTQNGHSRLPFDLVRHYEMTSHEDDRGLRLKYRNSRVTGAPEKIEDPQAELVLAMTKATTTALPELVISVPSR